MRRWLWLAMIAGFAASAGLIQAAAAAPPQSPRENYHIVRRVTLGGEGGWDYLGFDNAHRHLFVSHATHVIVLDADTLKRVGDIPDTEGVHGIAIAPKLGRGFVSDGRADQVTVFDLGTLKTTATVKVTGHDPDCILYDPATERVFTFNGRSGTSTAIDAKTLKVAGTIDLGGDPEFAVADGRGHIFNNLEDKSEELKINSRTLKIEARWPLAPCQSPSGLAIDARRHILFAGCRNRVMAVVDAETGKVLATPPIGPGVDADRFDPVTGLAFSSSGGDSGSLTVVKEMRPGVFKVVDRVATQAGARTMELDPKTHNVFTVTARFGPPPPAGPAGQGGPRRRRPMVPGTFTLIELAP